MQYSSMLQYYWNYGNKIFKGYYELSLFRPKFSQTYLSGDSIILVIKVATLFLKITEPFSGSPFLWVHNPLRQYY